MNNDNFDPFYGHENKKQDPFDNQPQINNGNFNSNNNSNPIKPYNSGASWFLKRFLPVFICILLFVSGILIGSFIARVSVDDDLRLLNWILQTIDNEYFYELTDAQREQLLNGMGKGAARFGLDDPYSDFYSTSEEDFYAGIGVSLATMKGENDETIDYTYISNVYRTYNDSEDNKPPEAFKNGIQKYDRFYSITTYYEDINLTKYVDAGTAGAFSKTIAYDQNYTYVPDEKTIVYVNPREDLNSIHSEIYAIPLDIEFDIVVKRDVNPEDSTDFITEDIPGIKKTVYDPSFVTYDKIDSDTAVIGLLAFTLESAGEFKDAITKFKTDGMKNLILDLRNNGGGRLDVLCYIAQYLITDSKGSKNVLVGYAKYKSESRGNFETPDNFYKNTFYNNNEKTGKITVLFNERSASASEALIGAMMDYGTCDYTIGVTSFGKGIMQSTFYYPNRDNAKFALQLTVAKIYWPVSGTCIHGVGITPEKIVPNGLFYPDGADKYANDLQVQAALSFISLP